jgi:hypothetical protein
MRPSTGATGTPFWLWWTTRWRSNRAWSRWTAATTATRALRRWWDDFLGTFPDYTCEVEELRDLGDVTLGHIRGWGRGAASDTPIVDPF